MGLPFVDHDDADGTQGEHALVPEDHYIPAELFTLRTETDFEKPRSLQSLDSPGIN